MKVNETIRTKAKQNGVKHWEIAAYLGVSEQTMVRWLRKPLDNAKEGEISHAIDALALKKRGGYKWLRS